MENMEKFLIIGIIILIVIITTTAIKINLNGSEMLETKESISEVEKNEEIITVTDKWIKRTNNKDLYMIGTENEVFKIEDNAFILKFNSSDIYSKIEIGKKYKIKTTGMRSNFLSWYRNINSIELYEGE